MPRKSAAIITHEYNSKGEHRIVIFEGGKPDAGEWVGYEKVAQHRDGLRAGTEYHQGLFPIGVFTCKKQDSIHLE